jgi:uncharacterized protein YggE
MRTLPAAEKHTLSFSADPNYEASMRRATEMLDALRAAVVSAGHDGKLLKTTSFNVNTKHETYRDKNNNYQSKFVGYCCTHGLRLEFDLDMKLLGVTLGAIATCDANPKFSIRFSVKDASAISAELLENAIENTKWKAGILAKSAGVGLGAILRIDYNWSEHHFYSSTDMRVGEDMLCLAEAAPMEMDIEPEDINVSDSATIVWAIE